MYQPAAVYSSPTIEGSMICFTLDETEDIFSMWNENTLNAHLKNHEYFNIKYEFPLHINV